MYLVDKSYTICYTIIMKTAISIDKELFEDAEFFSQTAGLSRSKLYCYAISEYIQNHTPDIVTERLNSYYGQHESRLDEGLKGAARRLFDKEEW